MKTEFNCDTVLKSINLLQESIKIVLLPASEDNFEENVNRISKLDDSIEKAQKLSHQLIAYKPTNGEESDLIYALIEKIDDFLILTEARKEFFEEFI
jgi:cellobiose-specific phosphotransferase system component IIA